MEELLLYMVAGTAVTGPVYIPVWYTQTHTHTHTHTHTVTQRVG